MQNKHVKVLHPFSKTSKNNQNQTNTTGAQNFKESNNTAGWLSVFFVFFFCNEFIKNRIKKIPVY
jgi:hypothetical protein